MARPAISYWTKSAPATPIDNGSLELSEPGNVTLIVKIPAADPPVVCILSTFNIQDNCTGTTGNDTQCKFRLFLGSSAQLVYITLEFIAYQPYTTRVTVLIKGGVYMRFASMH